ncbi:UPF0481 protein At3g47200-like [Cornus florida]|uniref:UPF0481 protein At3g47200-like n=1 Tax=Cornus florida TaxID=4283 RepID=UPI00289E88AE|nr:UPF0481 protein At3g47200-like [Cornus florida]
MPISRSKPNDAISFQGYKTKLHKEFGAYEIDEAELLTLARYAEKLGYGIKNGEEDIGSSVSEKREENNIGATASEKQEDVRTFVSEKKGEEDIGSSVSKRKEESIVAWPKSIKGTLEVLKERPPNFSIYRVPRKLRNINADAYSPRLISVGPFHNRREDLLKMDEHKWRYMQTLFNRTTDRSKTIDDCCKAIEDLKLQVPGCYAEDLVMTWHVLREILLVDGCFILELLIRYSQNRDEVMDEQSCDEVINGAWMMPTVKHDLALLENQIPFIVLEKLFEIIKRSLSVAESFPFSLIEYALHFFLPGCNPNEVKKVEKHKPNHLLEILHIFYRPSSLEPVINSEDGDHTWGFKHCATELLEAGIVIDNDAESDLLDITFSEGVIKLPPFSFDETVETIFRNLIAFEQCSVGVRQYITSYVMLTTNLIASPNDIKLLEEKKIIKTSQSNSGQEDVSAFFKRMGREVVLKEFCFAKLCKDVDAYSQSWWHCHRIKASSGVRFRRYMNVLSNDYFSNPWRIISFVAAVVLLILTLLQTIYTLYSFKCRP